MWGLGELIVAFAALLGTTLSTELTFTLPDNAKDCFYEVIEKGIKATIEFQVILNVVVS
jgi:protein ERP2